MAGVMYDKGGDGPAPVQAPWMPGKQPKPIFPTVNNPAPPRPSSPAPTYTSSTGTYSSGGGGGGGGNYSSYAAPSTPPPPPPMSINDWLNQDSTYQSQESALKKALTDYIAQQGVAKNQYNVDYTGRTHDLALQKTRSLDDQANDFASRGMYFSGVYGKDMSNLVGDFARRQSDMDTAKANYFANLANDLGNFQDQQQLTETKAKQDAINRRAAQYGL